MTSTDRSRLTLHEEILLLALRDEKGTEEWGAGYYTYTLAGAILSELLLASRVSIDESKKHLVTVVSNTRMDDVVLDEALQLIASSKREKKLNAWVTKIVSNKLSTVT